MMWTRVNSGRCLLLVVAVLLAPVAAQAGMVMLSGPPVGTHAGNLVTNGSFETGAPAPGWANHLFWATGTSLTPFGSPGGWVTAGNALSYARWGADSGPLPRRLMQSGPLPDGDAALYFGNSNCTVDLVPTFAPTGEVTFAGTPTIVNPTHPTPVRLAQTVPTHLTPAVSYVLSFWVSGEGAGKPTPTYSQDGIFGLRVTNVLPGDPVQYLAMPATPSSPLGVGYRYEFSFTPINPLLPVDIEFINWGHFDLTPFGSTMATELVLDDVMVNAVAVPEPATLGLLAIGGLGLIWRRGRN